MKRCVAGIALAALVLAASMVAVSAAPYVPILAGDSQFDPKCAEPAAVRQARIAAASTTLGSTISPDRNYYLVQFQGPVRAAWKNQAGALGAVFLDYIPRYAFIARMTAAQASAVGALTCVRWIAPVPARFKYRTSLVRDPKRPVTVSIRVFPGESLSRVGKLLYDRKLMVVRPTWGSRPTLYTRIAAGMVQELAALPEVAWIQEYQRPRLMNDQGQRWLNVSNVSGLPGGVDVWNDFGLFGAGQIVGIADTGLDTGRTTDLHHDFLDANGQPRLVQAFALGRADDWSDSTTPPLVAGGHGTHVTGSVLGSGAQSGSDAAAHSYAGSFAGIAPEARIVFQSLMDVDGGLGGLPFPLGPLFQQAYDAGARIHTNSWGYYYSAGLYLDDSAAVDDFLWTHPYMTILFAAGNDGVDWDADGVIDPGSVSAPSTAKDCISVGASESYRPPFSGWGGYAPYTWGEGWPYYYPVDPIFSDYISDNPGGIAAFSGRGPCVDGRIKPDLVAPGTNIISCRSRGKRGDYTGVEELWGIYSNWYLYSGGTSMATPLAAGAAALVREYYETVRQHPSPSGALIKATLINGGTDLAPGQYGTGSRQEVQPRPDRSQGWGRGNVGGALFPDYLHPNAELIFHDNGVIPDTGMVDAYPVTVSGPSSPLAVTLVWTDPAASPYSGTQLVNDLDLIVIDPNGLTYRGNFGLTPSNDRINNVEHIEIPAPVAGNYTVRVVGVNVAIAPQPYALAITAPTGNVAVYSISGSISSDQGGPIPNVTVTAESMGVTPVRRLTVVTDANGAYEIENVPPATYRVTPSSAFYSFTPTQRSVNVVNANVGGVNFTGTITTAPPEISGFVIDELARPVVGMTVSVVAAAGGSAYAGVTDANGHYVVRNLGFGAYSITPQPPTDHYVDPPSRKITLPSAESRYQNFSLRPLYYGYVDVYTRNPQQNPIPGVTLTVERSADESSWSVVQTGRTNAVGFMRLGTDVSGHRVFVDGFHYRIRASRAHYTFQITPFVDYVQGTVPVPSGCCCRPQPVNCATFYFWGGSPNPLYAATGLIRDWLGRTLPDVTVRLEGYTSGRAFQTRTGSNGFFTQTGMPADLYAITATKPGYTLFPIDTSLGLIDFQPSAPYYIRVGSPGYSPDWWWVYQLPEDMWTAGFIYSGVNQYLNRRQDYVAYTQ